jgi:hypothetical protein
MTLSMSASLITGCKTGQFDQGEPSAAHCPAIFAANADELPTWSRANLEYSKIPNFGLKTLA